MAATIAWPCAPGTGLPAPRVHPKLRQRDDLSAPVLRDLAELDDSAFRARFAGSPIKRIGRDRFVRNVLIAIGNSGSAELRETAARLVHDPDPVVAEAATWAHSRLLPAP